MNKCYLLLLTLFFARSFTANASHFQGMDIRYEYAGTGNIYRVYLNVYSECQTGGAGVFTNETISWQSASASVNSSRVLVPLTIDSVRDMWCSSVTPNCLGANPYLIVRRYSDTLTLAPHTDWKISCTDGSRSSQIINLAGVSTLNMYVEAFLNNSVAPNSSPIMVGDPQIFVPINTVVSQPFQVIDVDGDSVSGNMIQPMTASTANAPYNTGYTLSQPIGPGSFTQLSVANSALKIYSTNIGRNALAARVYDYRNGVLVGYSSRDWASSGTPATNPKAPTPAAGSNFLRSTCPGQINSYTFNFVDSVATDSVFLQFTPPANGLSYTTSYTSGPGSGSATISWVTPAAWSVAANPYFLIKLSAHDQQCPLSGYATYDVLVRSVQCNTDTVWAGDANDDYVVDMYDPLAIAQAYGATGPLRAGASLAWTAQWCANWSNSFSTGINYKHSDCDGNGTVNSSDLTAITTNYSLTHSRGEDLPYAKGAGNPDLYFDPTGISAVPGGNVTIPLKLGTAAFPMNTVYGLAARIRITGITPGAPSFSYPASWLGTAANTLRFSKSTGANTLDWAYARTDHQNTSGQGTIGSLSFGIPAGTNGQKVVLSMEGVRMIAANGTVLTAYNVLSDTITIHSLDVAAVSSPVLAAVITPNPSGSVASLLLNMSVAGSVEVMVTDIAGRTEWQPEPIAAVAGMQEIILPKALQSGLYLLRIKTGGATQVLKWLRD